MSKIGFIGMGNMAQAIASGFINAGGVPGEDILAYAPTREKLVANSERIGFRVADSLIDVIEQSEVIIIACKPYQIKAVLDEGKRALSGKALLSVAAGWSYEKFRLMLGESVRVQCIMPNTPAMVGEGVMLFEEKNSLRVEEREDMLKLFSNLGIVEEVSTELMGIAGVITGCGPAFMDMIIEAYADAGVKYGLQRDLAYRLVSQMMLGSGKLQLETGLHPGVLKDQVCSPRGTTIQGVAALEHNGLRSACIDSVDTIMDVVMERNWNG